MVVCVAVLVAAWWTANQAVHHWRHPGLLAKWPPSRYRLPHRFELSLGLGLIDLPLPSHRER
jgi:hypothetical protein